MIQTAFTGMALFYGASMVVSTGYLGIAALRAWRTRRSAAALAAAPTPTAAPIQPAPIDEEDEGPDPFRFDPLRHFCPVCLCQAREHELDRIDTGLPRLCEGHARRLSLFVSMGQGALSRALLGWQQYADRTTQKEVW